MALTPAQRARKRLQFGMYAAMVLAAGSGSRRWAPLTGAALHLDFVNRKYYWNGAERLATDFTSFTGGTFSSTGLVTDATAASRDINIAAASHGLSYPLAVIVNFTANSSADQLAVSINADTSNYVGLGKDSINRGRSQVITGGSTVADRFIAAGVPGVRETLGSNFETNNILQSLNGATGAAADTSATLPTMGALIISERPNNTQPFNGTIHHIVIASGAKTQAELNALTAAVQSL